MVKYIYRKLRNKYNKFNKTKRISRKLKISENSNIQDLLINGFSIFDSLIDKNILNNLIIKYQLDEKNFKKSYTNVTIPILDAEFINYISNHKKINSIVEDFYFSTYGTKAFLQIHPAIVITNPSFKNTKEHYNIPNKWHTDYKSEFTFHIPLTDINSDSTKTVYAEKSQNILSINPESNLNINDYESNIIPLEAKKGSVIFIDVSGAHKAELGKFRAMIQFKFTSGNDLLNELIKPQAYFNLGEKFKENFLLSTNQLKTSFYDDIQMLDNLSDKWGVIKESKVFYENFLKAL